VPEYVNGKINRVNCYKRNGHVLPLTAMFGRVVDTLHASPDISDFMRRMTTDFRATMSPEHAQVALEKAFQCLEVMLTEGWVTAKLDKKKPRLNVSSPDTKSGLIIHTHDLAEEHR
jgi:hypothetical protein